MLAVLASQMGDGGDSKVQSRVIQMVEGRNSIFLAGSKGPCLISFALDSEVMSLAPYGAPQTPRRRAGNVPAGSSDLGGLNGKLCGELWNSGSRKHEK